jgi:hypothetical protein
MRTWAAATDKDREKPTKPLSTRAYSIFAINATPRE